MNARRADAAGKFGGAKHKRKGVQTFREWHAYLAKRRRELGRRMKHAQIMKKAGREFRAGARADGSFGAGAHPIDDPDLEPDNEDDMDDHGGDAAGKFGGRSNKRGKSRKTTRKSPRKKNYKKKKAKGSRKRKSPPRKAKRAVKRTGAKTKKTTTITTKNLTQKVKSGAVRVGQFVKGPGGKLMRVVKCR
jgi:hypothetical protein